MWAAGSPELLNVLCLFVLILSLLLSHSHKPCPFQPPSEASHSESTDSSVFMNGLILHSYASEKTREET